MKKILGISAFYHDAAAAIVINGEVITAAQEERFNRKKHCAEFPIEAIQYCLSKNQLSLNDLDAVVFYEKPLLKFERLLETYYAFAPKGLLSFLRSMPVWLGEKLFLKHKIRKGLAEIGAYDQKRLKLLFSEHHLSHAASSFYPSPFEKSAVLCIDGVGEWNTASIFIGKQNQLQKIHSIDFPHSLGLLYSAFTYFLGFKVNSGEYKLMGLAPYGDKNAKETQHFRQLIKENLVHIKADGSIWLNLSYFKYTTGLKMIHTKKWELLFGLKHRRAESSINSQHCNLAWAIQSVTEEIVLKMAKHAKQLTDSENICLAGGVALNCVSNGELLNSNTFENIFIQPAAGDAGGAIGAALAINHLHFKEARKIALDYQPYLGPEYTSEEIGMLLKKHNVKATYYEEFSQLSKLSAQYLADGKIVGWFQGRMEFGPRALGNRSILADPRAVDMQSKLNLKVKFREGFRPFAPVVIEEDAAKYFNLDRPSPFMLFTYPLAKSVRLKKSSEKNLQKPLQQISQKRSSIPAVTHLDYSARVQTVNKDQNPKLYDLLLEFKELTQCSVLINTSFNVRGEPMVCSPEDALSCFMRTNIDYLILGNFLIQKSDQTKELKERFSNISFKKD
ncbi:MAG: carbamoyltransferase [Vicingaceae bacterium]